MSQSSCVLVDIRKPTFKISSCIASRLRSKKRRGARFALPFLSFGFLGLAQDAINSGAAYRALALRHTTTRVRDVYSPFELTLLFALNAVGLTFVCLSHFFLRSSQVCPANTLTIPPGHVQNVAIHARRAIFLAQNRDFPLK